MMMHGSLWKLLAIFLLVLFLRGVSSKPLYCFQCMSVECSTDEPNCDKAGGVRSFIKSELGSLYYTDQLWKENCPSAGDNNSASSSADWKLMESSNKPCPEIHDREPTCTAGTMELRVQVKHPNNGAVVSERVHHAIVLGCAKRGLVSKTNQAFGLGKCHMDVRNRTGSTNGANYLLKIQHCRDKTTLCYHQDYCVNQNMSNVRKWLVEAKKVDQEKAKFRLSWQICAFGFVVAVFVVYCWSWISCNNSDTEEKISTENDQVKVDEPIQSVQYSQIEENLAVHHQRSINENENKQRASASSGEIRVEVDNPPADNPV